MPRRAVTLGLAAALASSAMLGCGSSSASPSSDGGSPPPDGTVPADAGVDTAVPPVDAAPPPPDSGGGDAGRDAAPLGDASPPPATQIVAHFSDPQQTMDGFGAAEAFIPTITDAQADLFFSATNGIGLSILRMGI